MTTTLIDFMRHGEPVGGRRYRGQIDDPLSERGWQQMRTSLGNNHPWQLIMSSPLLRCLEFSSEVSQKYELPLIKEPRLMEIGFGEWEGLTAEEIEQRFPGNLQQFYQDPIEFRPQNAEPLAAFESRIAAALEDIIEKHQGKHILVVAHAGVIRMMMMRCLSIPLASMFRIKVNNAGLTRIQIDSENGKPPYYQLIFHGLQRLEN